MAYSVGDKSLPSCRLIPQIEETLVRYSLRIEVQPEIADLYGLRRQ